jgi:hypothetical protein
MNTTVMSDQYVPGYGRPTFAATTVKRLHHTRFVSVTQNDVLGGRGLTIAQHPGNKAFRKLVARFKSSEYCSDCTPQQKKAIGEKIYHDIKALNGRYLVKDSNQCWRVATKKMFLKKICQALRDCNRCDRSGYAKGVMVPDKVKEMEKEISEKKMSVTDLGTEYIGKFKSDERTCTSEELIIRPNHPNSTRGLNYPNQVPSFPTLSPKPYQEYFPPHPFYAMPVTYSNPAQQSLYRGLLNEAQHQHVSYHHYFNQFHHPTSRQENGEYLVPSATYDTEAMHFPTNVSSARAPNNAEEITGAKSSQNYPCSFYVEGEENDVKIHSLDPNQYSKSVSQVSDSSSLIPVVSTAKEEESFVGLGVGVPPSFHSSLVHDSIDTNIKVVEA